MKDDKAINEWKEQYLQEIEDASLNYLFGEILPRVWTNNENHQAKRPRKA